MLASAAAIGYAVAGHAVLSICLACMAVLAVVLRRWMLARMDALRTTMHDGDLAAIRRFRQLHVAGIGLNVCQLALVAWAMTQVTL